MRIISKASWEFYTMQQPNSMAVNTTAQQTTIIGLIDDLITVTDQISESVRNEQLSSIGSIVEKRKILIEQLDSVHGRLVSAAGGGKEIDDERIKAALVSLHLSSKKMQSVIEEKNKTLLNALQSINKHHFYNQ